MLSALVGTLITNLVGEKIKNKLAGSNEPVHAGTQKGIVQSKTMWGLAVAAFAPWLMRKLGLDMGEIQSTVDSISVLIGVGLAWWGRKTVTRSM